MRIALAGSSVQYCRHEAAMLIGAIRIETVLVVLVVLNLVGLSIAAYVVMRRK